MIDENKLKKVYGTLQQGGYAEDYNTFKSGFTGNRNYSNRKKVYDLLSQNGANIGGTYEEFMSLMQKGHTPMSDADKARFSSFASGISAQAGQAAGRFKNTQRADKLRQQKKKEQGDFGRVQLGTKKTASGTDNATYDKFGLDPYTGKVGTYITSSGEEIGNEYEAGQQQQAEDKANEAYNEAVESGDIPSAFDVVDKKGNYDLFENVGKNGVHVTEEGAQRQLDNKIGYAQKRLAEINARIKEIDNEKGNPFLRYSATLGAPADENQERKNLGLARNQIEQELRTLDAIKREPDRNVLQNLWQGFSDTALNPQSWDFGLNDFAIMGKMEGIKYKIDNHIPLTSDETRLAQSKIGADAASALSDERMGNAYRWSGIAGQSVPFMFDFLVTGGYGGLTKAAGKAAIKYAAKRGMGAFGKNVLKYTGVTAANIVGSYAMAGTEQAFKTGADIMSRHLGTLYKDENGSYNFGTFDENGNLLHDGGEDFGTALYKGLTAAMLENYTEKFFRHTHFTRATSKALSSHFPKFASFLAFKGAPKWMKRLGIDGLGEEIMEEEINIPLNSLLVGDNKMSDLGDLKQQGDIIFGIGLSVGAMYAMSMAPKGASKIYNNAQYYRFNNAMNSVDNRLTQLMGDRWAELKDKIDNTPNEKMGGMIRTILQSKQDGTLNEEEINTIGDYINNLSKVRGYNLAKTTEVQAKADTGEETTPEEQHQQEQEQAYAEGQDAEGEEKNDIQQQTAEAESWLASLLGVSEEQLDDIDLDGMVGQNDELDLAIYDYQTSKARYQGVIDNAQSAVDAAEENARAEVQRRMDKSRGTVRNATIKSANNDLNGGQDYGVYIVSGNVAQNEDGSINVADSDDMILYFDPLTGKIEHSDASRFASIGDEVDAEQTIQQTAELARQDAIAGVTRDIDGIVGEGSQFVVIDNEGQQHTYEVLADNGDGTASISIDGNVMENVFPTFDELQKLKDDSDKQRISSIVAAKEANREQKQQEAERKVGGIDFSKLLDTDGNITTAIIDGEEDRLSFVVGRTPSGKLRIAYLNEDGTIEKRKGLVSPDKVMLGDSVSVDEYKELLGERYVEQITNSDTIEGDSTKEVENGGKEETPSIESETESTNKENQQQDETKETEELPTFSDGSPIPLDKDGEADFTKMTPEQSAEWHETNLGEDAIGVLDNNVTNTKKTLDKARTITIKGAKPSEMVKAKQEKDAAIASAQAAYDNAVAVRNAYEERQIERSLQTREGRKELLDKAKAKYDRLKNKDEWKNNQQALWNETVGKVLHRLYDNTSVDVFDPEPQTVEEYVSSHLLPFTLNYEGTETSKGVKQETGLERKDFAKSHVLAAEGKGKTVDDFVHKLWENRPPQLENATDQDVRNAVIGLITSDMNAYDMRHVIENNRIAEAEKEIEDEKRAAENATQQEEQSNEQQPSEEEDTSSEEEEQSPAKEEETPSGDEEELPENNSDNLPFGEQLKDEDLPFSTKEDNSVVGSEERKEMVEKNKVTTDDISEAFIPKKMQRAIARVAKMMPKVNGKELKVQYLYSADADGWFDRDTNTLYLALDSSKALQMVFGHEMTHAIKSMNTAAYDELRTLVKDFLGDEYDKYVDSTEKFYNAHGVTYSNRADYEEEVIADGIGSIINDLNMTKGIALRMSHPLLSMFHDILMKIRMAFRYDRGTYDFLTHAMKVIEKAYVDTAKGTYTDNNGSSDEHVAFSLRQKPDPKKKGVGYKVFVLGKDGKLYPPMVANPNGADTPVGVWLDADAAPIAGESKTGRPQVKQGGKGTQGGSGKLAYRPGWHLGTIPYALQFNRKDAEGNKTLFPKNFVFAEVEYAADKDYQDEAYKEGVNASGKYQHSLAGLKHLPTDGYYMYRTNPNPETDPWVITGAMKVNRILTRAEQADLVRKAGREPQLIQDGDIVTDEAVNAINQEIANAPKFSLKVYHGSGADFDEFDFDHMGEGAGSQAFGWGGYVTSSKNIGKSYAKVGQMSAENNRRGSGTFDPLYSAVGAILGQEMYNSTQANTFELKKKQAIENNKNMAKAYEEMIAKKEYDEKTLDFARKDLKSNNETLAVLESLTEEQYNKELIKQGRAKNFYEVEIPEDNGKNYLDWYAPLTDEIIDKVAKELPTFSSFDVKRLKNETGKELYNTISMRIVDDDSKFNDDKAASKFLSSLGFTGIKYPAGTILGGAKEGDMNYVIFNPEDMKITEHTKFSIRTYHGSQASFDQFDHSFMGSGEGAQAYGWGTYVSEVEGIARTYAKQNAAKHSQYDVALKALGEAKENYKLAKRDVDDTQYDLNITKSLLEQYQEKLDNAVVNNRKNWIKEFEQRVNSCKEDISKMEKNLAKYNDVLAKKKKELDDIQSMIDKYPKPERNLYTVEIPDDNGDNYLDWDGKVKQKMLRKVVNAIDSDEAIKNKLVSWTRNLPKEWDSSTRLNYAFENMSSTAKKRTGQDLYNILHSLLGSAKEASLFLSSVGVDGVKVIAQRNNGGNKEGRMNYVIFDENNAKIVNHEKFSLKETNDKFNSDLKAYVENGVLPKNGRFELGNPSKVLQKAGFPMLPISMRVSLLNKKAGMERHPFAPTDLHDMVKAIQKPLAIFEYTKPNMRNLIIDLAKKGKHFLVGVTLNYKKGEVAVNSISGLFPKESHEWIKWIQDGKAIRIDQKEKVLSLINSLRTTPEEAERIGLNLDSAAKIVNSFDNSKENGEKFSLRDKEYLKAVEDGDMEKAQKMVNEAAEAVAFHPNQIKPADNNNGEYSSSDNDIRFSLKDSDKTMFGMHNISVDKLRKAIKQGGFAAPSMGVVDSKNGVYSDYGEITLIPKAELLDKRKGKNAGTFTADAWTPTYPHVEMRQTKDGKDKLHTDTLLNDGIPDEIGKALLNKWESYINNGSSRPNDFAWQYMYENGMNPKVTYFKSAYPKSISSKVMKLTDNGAKRMKELTKEENGELIKLYNAYLEKKGEGLDDKAVKEIVGHLEELKEKEKVDSFKQNIQRKIDYFKEFGGDINKAQDWAWQGVVPSAKEEGKVNHAMTLHDATLKADASKKMQADLQTWFEGKLNEYGVEEYLYNGETASGKPKYVPNTVENAVKIMKKQGLAGGYNAFSPGVGAFIAKYAPSANTLASMKKSKDKLIPFGDERHNEVRDKILGEYNDLARSLTIKPTDVFDDSGTYRMQELADVKPQDLKKYISDNWNKDVSDEWVERYNKLVDTIQKDYPVYYFETKFMRPVGLDEFEKAIVPKDTPKDVTDALKKAGIDVHTYDGKEDRERATMDAINDRDDIMFSIRTYHGTGAKFDNFDLSHALEGEGSETFGHGVYVTNSEVIGSEYAKRQKGRLSNNAYYNVNMGSPLADDWFRYFYRMIGNDGFEDAKKNVLDEFDQDIKMFSDAINGNSNMDEHTRQRKDAKLAEMKRVRDLVANTKEEDLPEMPHSYRYDVEIPDDDGTNYLSWNGRNKNIPQQMFDNLTKVLEQKGWNIDGQSSMLRFIDANDNTIVINPNATGADLYEEISSAFNSPEEASKLLSMAGFTGIKYPAGMIHGGAKEGDYNYVIFKESDAKIVGNTKFSLRYSDYEKSLADWKKRNGLAKDAKQPEMPQQLPNESKFDFMKRVNKYLSEKALWNTAPTYEGHLMYDQTAVGYLNSELQRRSVLARIAVQDSMLPLRKAQEGIMRELGLDKIGVGEDVYTAENRSHGKAKNEFEEYNQVYLQPLRKAYHAMKQLLGDSYDNVKVYMMSKHGLERNPMMAFRNALKKDFTTKEKGKKDVFDADGMSKAYEGYKTDVSRIMNDANYANGTIDYATYRQNDDAIRTKYAPSYPEYRYDKDGNLVDYSGLSTLYGDAPDFEVAAAENVRNVENAHKTEAEALWSATNAATKRILKDSYLAGMMSKDVYDYVGGMYDNYIPLRGWDGTSADQVWDYVGGGRGAFNQVMKKAEGRKSIADDPIAYIENMAESTILLNNKNYVKQHLLLLAENHPTDLLTLSKAWYVKSRDAFGNDIWTIASPNIPADMTDPTKITQAIAQFDRDMRDLEAMGEATQKRGHLNIEYPQTSGEQREHEVRVLRDGEEYVIYVNGDPQLAQAVNNARARKVRENQTGLLDRGAAWLGRKMAAAYTSLSPLFIPANFTRDLTMTLASTAIREDARYNYLLRKNFLRNWNTLPLVMKYNNGTLREKVEKGSATETEKMFYDFMMNGGETGFVSSMDVEDFKRKIQEDMRDMDRWKTNPKRVGHAIMDSIELLNRAIEDSNRFLVYMTSIQYGRPIEEAVNNAKDVTLNFNRKGTGEYGWQMVRNLYLFINPAIQSLQTLGALAKKHPYKFTAVTSLWLASGALVPMVNSLMLSMFGDDDDKDKYWSFTKWDRRNNFIMWIPFTKDFIKIPLAQEFRGFYGVGDMIASKMIGGEKAEESWNDYASDFMGQVVDMLPLDPTGYDGNVVVSLMPNAVRPIFELAFNIDFTGKPLFNDNDYNKFDPNFTKAYAGTPDWLVRTSRFVNSFGNPYPDVQQNAIDRFGNPRYNLNNPAVVDHVLSSYLGGAYTFGSQAFGVLTKALNSDAEIKVADIPLLSRFAANPDDRPVSKKQGDEFWNMKEQQDRTANTLSKLKKEAKRSGDFSVLEGFYKSDQYAKFKDNEPRIKQYEEDRKKEKAEKEGEAYKPHKLTGNDMYKKHASNTDDFEDMKMDLLWKKVGAYKTIYDGMVSVGNSKSDEYYREHYHVIDAADEAASIRSQINELKKGMLTDGKETYNADDMRQVRELRKEAVAILENAAKTIPKK